MRKLALLTAVATSMIAIPAQAAGIDFETTPSGNYASGGLTVGGVTFSDAIGNALQVGNFGSQGDGQSLGVFDDTNGNYLIGDLSSASTSMSLDFGNDDPNFTNATDLATLNLYLLGVLVGTQTMSLNRDDVMNQTISYSGGPFDRFTFAYTDAAGTPFTGGGAAATGLIEIVDNIVIGPGAVPEPSTWAMMLLGFFGMGIAVRRERKVTTAQAIA